MDDRGSSGPWSIAAAPPDADRRLDGVHPGQYVADAFGDGRRRLAGAASERFHLGGEPLRLGESPLGLTAGVAVVGRGVRECLFGLFLMHRPRLASDERKKRPSSYPWPTSRRGNAATTEVAAAQLRRARL